jgi:hypothetical protein
MTNYNYNFGHTLLQLFRVRTFLKTLSLKNTICIENDIKMEEEMFSIAMITTECHQNYNYYWSYFAVLPPPPNFIVL